MDYKTDVFGFDAESLTQVAEGHTIERTARIDGDKLIMESEIDRRILRWSDLPQDGPILESGYPLMDWAYRISRRDIESNFYPGGIYAGEQFKHGGTWVRDTSFTSMMGLAMLYPQRIHTIFANLLDEKLGEIQFEQYRGYYEDRYFSMTDQILWVLAVEKLARVQGDDSLLVHGLPYAAKTVSRMLEERFDARHFLIAGGSSLFDGHSGFPKGMTGPLLRSCSTDLLYLRALRIMADMDVLDARTRESYLTLRQRLAEALDRELWLDDRGYYAQLQYGENYREERFETLGNVIALANPEIPVAKANAIVAAIKQHPYGVPALTPWYADRIVYHSEGIWPFMMGLMLWARHERGDGLDPATLAASGADSTYITAQLLRTGMLEGTFMELLHGRTGQGRYSPAQVWSASAMLSAVEYGLFGMNFEADRIVFKPSVPSFLTGRTIRLRDVELRGRTVTLELSSDLTVSVDGRKLPDNTLIFAEHAMNAMSRKSEPVELDASLLSCAEAEGIDWSAARIHSGDGVELRVLPDEIVVWPGEQQIGSYAIALRIANTSAETRTVALKAANHCRDMALTAETVRVDLAPGQSVEREIRLGFTEPPVHFGGGCVILEADGLTDVAIPVRRFLTLDCSWRFKPTFKHRSLGYGREFRHFDYWDMLRVPMRAEFRHGPYQGVLWYAKKLIVPDDWTGADLVFYCGAMSDWDVTYFNGTIIGRTGKRDEKTLRGDAHGLPRTYVVPAEIIKPGRVNTIAIQVYCRGQENGLWKGPVFLSKPNEFDWAMAMGNHVLESNFLPEIPQGANAAH